MKTFRIVTKNEVHRTYEIKAKTKEEAKKIIDEGIEDGDIDWTNERLVECEYIEFSELKTEFGSKPNVHWIKAEEVEISYE